MSSSRLVPLLRHVSLIAATVGFAWGAADAQVVSSHDLSADSSISSSESSSSAAADPMPADPSPSGSAAAQESGGYGRHGGSGYHSLGSRMTFAFGAGFNAPVGNDGPFITWGGNFTLGGGLRLSRRISVLGEYQFMDNKLPGSLNAQLNLAGGGPGTSSNSHINSLTVDPVIDLFPKWTNSAYLVGGGGWYHKSTNFNVQQCCDFYGFPVTVTDNSFSTNQLGANIGLGISHRLGGMYGEGKTRVFAEARYTFLNTPKLDPNNPQGFGSTELIPVTLGVRF